jgi:hypothetical protein
MRKDTHRHQKGANIMSKKEDKNKQPNAASQAESEQKKESFLDDLEQVVGGSMHQPIKRQTTEISQNTLDNI